MAERGVILSGNLKWPITLESPDQTPDALGQKGRKKGTWQLFAAGVWAEKIEGEAGQKEGYPESREVSARRVRWRIRHAAVPSPPTAKMRLFDTRRPDEVFEVLTVSEIGHRGGWEMLTEQRY